jgi:hypothetical protein
MTEKAKNKIDITKIDLEKEKDKVTEIPGILSFPHNIGSQLVKPEDRGKTKGRAMAAMKEQTERQMSQIYRQIKLLAEQAAEIRRRVELSERIYQVQMNFEPIIGHTYYLYEKNDGEDVLSMISLEEWGDSMPYKKYLAMIKLLSDHTWEILEDHDNLKNSSEGN